MNIKRWFWFHFWYHRYWYYNMIKDFFTLKSNKPIWYQVTTTYDGKIKSTYVNGDLVDEKPIDGFSVSVWFKGDIDSVFLK